MARRYEIQVRGIGWFDITADTLAEAEQSAETLLITPDLCDITWFEYAVDAVTLDADSEADDDRR